MYKCNALFKSRFSISELRFEGYPARRHDFNSKLVPSGGGGGGQGLLCFFGYICVSKARKNMMVFSGV